ncbi:MAG: MotA/TolQ/ExbB proton channel family protein [Zavarzinella sp.]
MRKQGIAYLLPTLFCLVPGILGLLIFFAIPSEAMRDYLARIKNSPIDWVILGLGSLLFSAQTYLAWHALRWQIDDFNEKPDRWLNHLASAAEWFPLLGLIGTVAAILQTFSSIGAPGATPEDTMPREIIRRYAPAITATGSGLFMALMNILPTWTVQIGRDIIRSLAGTPLPREDQR